MNFQNQNLVLTAEAMLKGKMHLIEGCRKICFLRHKTDDPENSTFLPIRGVESETDHFPLGIIRQHCAPQYLRRMDIEMERYMENAREDIHNACREIIKAFK